MRWLQSSVKTAVRLSLQRKFAYQYWVDTSANPALIKQRNAANDGWVTLAEVNGQLLAKDGTLAKPSISFSNDTSLACAEMMLTSSALSAMALIV